MRETTVREKIMETAGRLFFEQGYHQTGINQVIEEADIARGSLYNHFQSKTEVLLAYLAEFQATWYEALEAHLAPITDPKQRLLALFDYRVKSQERLGFRGCAFVKIYGEVGDTDPVVMEKVAENKKKLKAYIRNMVRLSGHRQMLTDSALTEMVYLLMEGGVISAAIFKHPKDLQEGKRLVEQFL